MLEREALADQARGEVRPAPPKVAAARPKTGQVPAAGKRPRKPDEAANFDEDKTKENRGTIGIKHDNSSLTANAASGTIGGDTPVPIFDRAAITAGASGPGAALATRPATEQAGGSAGTGPISARGTPGPTPAPPPRAEAGATRPELDETAVRLDPSEPRLAVPVGEFDQGYTVLEQDKLRLAHSQATIVRDAANALLGLPELAPPKRTPRPSTGDDTLPRSGASGRAPIERSEAPPERGDPTSDDVSRSERGDPTAGELRGDETSLAPPTPTRAPAGTLRASAALPRRRGLAGDIRYIGTVVLGLRAARRELAELAARQATRQQSRRHHLITLGRSAVANDRLERRAEHPLDQHPALAPAREQLTEIEDERSQHAGHVIAADAELARVRRDREAKAKQYVTDLAALDTELAALTKKLEPLEKQAVAARKRATDLHDALRRFDDKIAATDASLAAIQRGQGGKLDRADVQAELATLKADRKALQADEPSLAAELDSLDPRIAALEAARGEAQRKRTEVERAEQDDQRRVEELLTAIGAKRKVVDRAAADAEARRDKILFELGERLYVDRPDDLIAELAPVDEIDVELGVADRRMMELREILTSVHRLKLARGIALVVLALGAAGTLAGWLIYQLA